jgi:hypothetical protein
MRLASFALVAIAAVAQFPPGLVGRWRSAETSSGGLGAMFEFFKDGTFNFSAGAVVETKYRIEGNQLILPSGTINGPEQRLTMEWVNADHMVLNGSETLSRQGTSHDTTNPIVGEWTAPRETGGVKSEVRWFFEPDGTGLLLYPFKWQKGSYSVKNGTIRIEYPGSQPVEGPFRFDGTLLTIPSSGKTGKSQLKRY